MAGFDHPELCKKAVSERRRRREESMQRRARATANLVAARQRLAMLRAETREKLSDRDFEGTRTPTLHSDSLSTSSPSLEPTDDSIVISFAGGTVRVPVHTMVLSSTD